MTAPVPAPASPWAPLGNYLAARSLVRKATLAKELDRAALTDAERELTAIIAAPDVGGSRARAARLLNLVAYQLHPEEQVRALARRVAGGTRDLKNDLTDYVWLITRTRWEGAGEGRARPLVDLAKLRADDEMSDWILGFDGIGGLWVDENDEPRRRQEALAHALLERETLDGPEAVRVMEEAGLTRAWRPANPDDGERRIAVGRLAGVAVEA